MTTPQTTPELLAIAKAEFEAWYGPRYGTALLQPGAPTGFPVYAWDETNKAWLVWQAALAATQGVTAAPLEGVSVPPGYVLVREFAGADDIVTRLYRRFKEWSARGFGPEDVTWCEVKADINAMVAAHPQPPASALPLAVGEEPIPEDIVNYVKGIYDFLESTSPAGFAEEAFRLPPAPTRNQRSLSDLVSGDAHGQLLPAAGPDQRLGDSGGKAVGVTALPPPGRGMVPMTEEQSREIFRQVQAEAARMEAEHRYTFAGWFPVAVRLIEAYYGITAAAATALGDGEGAR